MKKNNFNYWVALLVSLLFFTSSCSNSTKDDTTPDTENRVQKLLNALKKDFKNAGIVAAVKLKDGTIERGVFGNSHEGTPMTDKMSYGIASNTKTFTAALVLKLVEEGKLKLSNTVGEILPNAVTPNKVAKEITIRQLLNHSSGIHDPFEGLIPIVIQNPSKEYSLKDILLKVKNAVFQPGEKHDYSNTNYTLLGHIIEKVSGVKYHTYLRNTILDPLSLKATFLMGKEKSTNTVAYSWFEDKQSLKDLNRTAIASLAWSSGSIFSSLDDMITWYEALFSGKVISQASLKIMQELNKGGNLEYGMGTFGRKDSDGNQIYWHSGQTLSYVSLMSYHTKSGKITVCIANREDYDLEKKLQPDLDALK